MQIKITNEKGVWDVTSLVHQATWSGDYRQVSRTLNFSLLYSASDSTMPRVDCPVGCPVQLLEEEQVLFDGFLINRATNTDKTALEILCYDRGFYLHRNHKTYQFKSTTPEAIAAQIAADFSVPVGKLATTGFSMSRNFITGNDSLYDIIATAYTLASSTTKQQYHIGFRGKELYITEKAPDDKTLILQGKSNLISLNTLESMENMVNAVQIVDQNGAEVRLKENGDLIKQYGRLQQVLQQAKDNDRTADAQKLLDDGGVHQTVSVQCLGNVANITGGTVVVQEPHSGVYGLFYIDSDTHEWKRGQYYNKLTLNFKAIMDEKEAGSLPNSNGKG